MNDKRLPDQKGLLLRAWPNMACLVVFLLLISLVPATLWAATFYVDATLGDDNNNGTTISSPWKSLRKVRNYSSFSSGDKILFKRGEVWADQYLTLPADGLTIGAYDSGALPVFDGSKPVSWTSVGAGIWEATWTSDPGMVLYDGKARPPILSLTFSSDVSGVQDGAVLIQSGGTVGYNSLWVTSVDVANKKIYGITFFRNPKHWDAGQSVQLRQVVGGKEVASTLTLAVDGLDVDPKSLRKSGDWYWDTDRLYLFSEIDPNSIVKVSNRADGIYANRRQNLTIEDIAVQGYQDTGVRLRKTVDSTVQRMEVSNIGATIYKSGIILDHSSNNNILNNQVESVLRAGISFYAGESTTDFSRNNIVSGNTIQEAGSSGVSLGAATAATADTVKNNTITGNTILNSNTLAWDSAGVYALFVGTHTIKNNRIMYGGSKYLRSSGIMLDQGVAATSITGNVITGNSFAGIAVTGRGHTITGNRLTDNGLSSSESAQIVFFTVTENASDCTVRSNIVTANGSHKLFLVVNGRATGGNLPHSIDYNTYKSVGTKGFCWSNDWTCDQWLDFNTWKNTSGDDAHSTFSFITEPPPPDVKTISSTYLLLLK